MYNCLRCIKPYMYFQIYLFHKLIIKYISSLPFVETFTTHTSSRENTCTFRHFQQFIWLKSLDCGFYSNQRILLRPRCVQEKCVYLCQSLHAKWSKMQKLWIFKKESIHKIFSFIFLLFIVEIFWYVTFLCLWLISTMFAVLVLEPAAGVVWEKNTAGWLVAGGCCWSSVREKHCWLVLEQNKRTGRVVMLVFLFLCGACSWLVLTGLPAP